MTANPSPAGDKPFWARCSNADCAHCWPIAYLPMDMQKFAKIADAEMVCPKCASGKPWVAKQNNGELLEQCSPGSPASATISEHEASI